jgi:hypothetical protein
MQYARSGTALDQAGAFMPQKLLGIGRFSARGLRGGRGLGDSGVMDYGNVDTWGFGADVVNYGDYLGVDPAPMYPTDPANNWPTDSSYYPMTAPPVATQPAGVIFPSSASEFNWSQLPALARDLFVAAKQGEVQSKLLDVNVQRARQGLPPLNAAAYAPGVNIGLNKGTQQFLGVGVGTLAVGAVAAAFLLTRRKSKRR